MQLRGEASLNVSGRALRKDFILKLGSIKASGKALLGGRKFQSANMILIFLKKHEIKRRTVMQNVTYV